ncbi:AFR308Wp [Eremothecium gossypii ATCC 10895]|uniref:Pre-mRNA-splicing factor SYF2 n=1 Tax=Eremothecium gossypii (strain ATCC 10895 / CBS 109.51 / FGSC 9923 / NRRL Y-1056) TaxID=284811 RepID=SYF2_EREGS|nr:AFR308Wp [Eremothecium gossypii ATCC 10895]Q753K4.1 RecName: Full=Pre-mRNA-splicing factor SYF2 [Eremothecium gossypii ATCC 10895]AAS53679.1 AFR308Wp [Eremothecium gossypii ATCC 10895]
MGIEDINRRLRQLKKKRVDASIRNRKEAASEERARLAEGKPRVYSMAEEPADEAEADDTQSEQLKLLNYRIADYEKWDEKQKRHKQPSDGADLGELANSTYRSELHQLHRRGVVKGRATNGRISASGKVVLDDEPELVEKLAAAVQQTAKRRHEERQKKAAKDGGRATAGSLNDKNRHFNEKLDREFRKRGQ